jgi:hypothetical protein
MLLKVAGQFLLALTALAGVASAETLGALSFKPIAGWKRSTSGGAVAFTRTDESAGTFAVVTVNPTVPSAGGANADFAAAWPRFTAAFAGVATPAPQVARGQNGWSTAVGGTELEVSGMKSMLLLTVWSDGRRAVPVVLITNDAGSTQQFTAWMASVSLASGGAPAQRPAAAAPVPGGGGGAPVVVARTPQEQAAIAPKRRGRLSLEGPEIAGIWMGFKTGADVAVDNFGDLTLDLVKTKPRWLTFFADGTFYEGVPAHGTWSLDPEEAVRLDPDEKLSFGTWTRRGDRVQAVTKAGHTTDYDFGSDGRLHEDAKTTGSAQYRRAGKIDPRALEGTWSPWQRFDESQAAPHWTSRPLVAFAADGRFSDRGAFMLSQIDPVDRSTVDRRPGTGRWSVEGYTLMLRYDDGREVHWTLSPPLGTGLVPGSRVCFVGRWPFYRQ